MFNIYERKENMDGKIQPFFRYKNNLKIKHAEIQNINLF